SYQAYKTGLMVNPTNRAPDRAPGRYNLHLGGNRIGTRIPRMYKENITEPEILASLDELIGRWAKEREAGEGFGDFTVRAGIIRPVLDPARDLWD
ncbi:hypothetical protein ACUOCP_19120, partial [Escherichia sp. R-CC3]